MAALHLHKHATPHRPHPPPGSSRGLALAAPSKSKYRKRTKIIMAMAATAGTEDRLAQLKAFDDTQAGVKGLVDAGVTTVPPIFHHPPDPLDDAAATSTTATIPVIDLAAFSAHHQDLVAQVKAAAETVGFFQVLNHGVPDDVLARMLASVRAFNEATPVEERRRYYTRDPARRVRYQSNFDLFTSRAASWRDTIFFEGDATEAEVPAAFRDVVPEYTQEVRELGARLLALLSEALGLPAAYLQRDAGCLGGPALGCHYYPPCPEPGRTVGTARHSDPSFLTVLQQDDAVGGLQALVNGAGWVDVPPLPGALVVNVGDFLQLMSNDRFKSVEHRVVAVPATAAGRVSAACFFRPTGAAALNRAYGPLPDLVKPPESPRYRSVTAIEFLGYYRQKGLDGRSALDHFRLP